MSKKDINPKMVALFRDALEQSGKPVKSDRGFQYALVDLVTPTPKEIEKR